MFLSRYVKKPINPVPNQLLNPQYHFMRMNYPEQCRGDQKNLKNQGTGRF